MDTKSPGTLCDSIQLPSSPSGLHRFQGAARKRLPTECPPSARCQTDSQGLRLNVKHRPLPPEGVKKRA